MYERLLTVDITTRGACADSVRNVTACPYAGVSPDEPFDVAPYCMAIHDYFLFNPLNLTLPRKFKIAVEGCPEDCAQGPVNDIGLYAKLRDGVRGFSVYAGGGLGAQPFLAKHIADFVPADDIAHLVRGDRAGTAPPRGAQEPQPGANEVRRQEARHR